MTIKELKEILDGCNEQAIVCVACNDGLDFPTDRQIFQTSDGSEVIIDLRYSKYEDQ